MANFNTTTWPANHPAKTIEKGVCELYAEYEISAALAVNDTIRTKPLLPKNARLLDMIVAVDDLDTNGTPTIALDGRVSDGTTDHDAFTGSAAGQAGGLQRATSKDFIGTVLANGNFYGEVDVATGPATGATTGTIKILVLYTMDVPSGEWS